MTDRRLQQDAEGLVEWWLTGSKWTRELEAIPLEYRQRAKGLWDLVNILEKAGERSFANDIDNFWQDVRLSDDVAELSYEYADREDEVEEAVYDAVDNVAVHVGLVWRQAKKFGASSIAINQGNKEGTVSSLRNRVIRLAHSKPEIRDTLLQVLKETRTAGEDWALVAVEESDLNALIAMPASWLTKGVDKYDAEVMDQRKAESMADFTVGPGSLKSAFKSIDDLFATVRDLYTLSDEGYISNANALKALK